MDDANVPSLIALPYVGSCRTSDATYRNTRGFVLSDDDMYYYSGRAGKGLGGPHSGLDMIWPWVSSSRLLPVKTTTRLLTASPS